VTWCCIPWSDSHLYSSLSSDVVTQGVRVLSNDLLELEGRGRKLEDALYEFRAVIKELDRRLSSIIIQVDLITSFSYLSHGFDVYFFDLSPPYIPVFPPPGSGRLRRSDEPVPPAGLVRHAALRTLS
jgi:hypothetical protein